MPPSATRRSTKHEEVTRALLEMAGSLKPGDQLPSQTELMRRFGVSDRTVLRSLEALRRDGLIVRRRGSGTFVPDPRERLRMPGAIAAQISSTTIAAMALTYGPFYQHCVHVLSVQAETAGLALICHHAHDEMSFEDALPLEALHPRGFVIFSYCVYGNQELGGWMACRNLLDLGHRRIAYAFGNRRYPLENTLRWRGHRRSPPPTTQSIIVVPDLVDRGSCAAPASG
jgi:hypothetical protein